MKSEALAVIRNFELKKLGVFLISFLFLHFGSIAMIGIMTQGGRYYFPWLESNLNYPDQLRKLLLHGAGSLLNWTGHPTSYNGKYYLKLQEGGSIQLVYSCLGLGLISFWIAFVVSGDGVLYRKLIHVLVGTILIVMINICRLTALGLCASVHRIPQKQMPSGNLNMITWSDHHFIFNVISYLMLFFLCICHSRQMREMNKN